MQIDLNKIISILDDAQQPPDKRGALLSLALARAVGYSLDLPTSPVNDPVPFYISNIQELAETAVCQVNERIAIDVTKTCDLIKAVWMFRYRLVYNASNPTVRSFLDGLIKVGSSEFPGYVSELMIGLPDSSLLDYIASIVKDSFAPQVATEAHATHIDNQAVYGRVISLAEAHLDAKRGSVKPETRLRQDLHADEHDQEQFVEALEKAFKVKLVKDVEEFSKFKTIDYCAKAVIAALSKK